MKFFILALITLSLVSCKTETNYNVLQKLAKNDECAKALLVANGEARINDKETAELIDFRGTTAVCFWGPYIKVKECPHVNKGFPTTLKDGREVRCGLVVRANE